MAEVSKIEFNRNGDDSRLKPSQFCTMCHLYLNDLPISGPAIQENAKELVRELKVEKFQITHERIFRCFFFVPCEKRITSLKEESCNNNNLVSNVCVLLLVEQERRILIFN